MKTITVTVKPGCEELLSTLPRWQGWYLESEEYADDGTGTIVIATEDDFISFSVESALDNNPDVIKYEYE